MNNYKKFDHKVLIVIIFIVFYSLFVFFVDYTFDHYTEILGATVFFFALFTGFFISRQNDRYCNVCKNIAKQDAIFSFLYRVSGTIPSIQDRVREITVNHYLRIKKSQDWAYHINHPSTSITDLTYAFREMDKKKNLIIAGKPTMLAASKIIWEGIKDLQHARKQTVVLKNQKLLLFQWIIVYMLAALLVISLNFIPVPEELYVSFLKIFFGTSVFMVIILLKQLDDLSIFGKDFTEKIADDVLWVVEERDKEATGILTKELAQKIKQTREKIEQTL